MFLYTPYMLFKICIILDCDMVKEKLKRHVINLLEMKKKMKLKIYIPYFFLFGSWRYPPPPIFFFFLQCYMWHSTLWLTLHGVIFPVKLERIHGTVHKDGQVRWGYWCKVARRLYPGPAIDKHGLESIEILSIFDHMASRICENGFNFKI